MARTQITFGVSEQTVGAFPVADQQVLANLFVGKLDFDVGAFEQWNVSFGAHEIVQKAARRVEGFEVLHPRHVF